MTKTPNHATVGRRKFLIGAGGVTAGSVALFAGCSGDDDEISEIPQNALDVAKSRGLKEDDVLAAVKTYVPSGSHDTHYMFASGGHSGQVWVIGIPSMRMLKVIPVFSQSSYQGWAYTDESKEVLAGGKVDGKTQTFADTHHTALSEQNGSYDGKWLFINDKVNSRIAVIDLKDFHTKQIVKNPLEIDDHGCAVTPNTEYVIESSQYETPLGWEYAPMTQASYNDTFRGTARFWKFDRSKGRIDESKSFSIELPPYCQDLADGGKGECDGWAFMNSFNTERAIVGGKDPMEKGAAARDMDYLHVINWKAAEKAVQDGLGKKVRGTTLIPMDVAAKQGILYLIPEPKSPHGVDVSPKGDYIVVSGKLDPQATVYSFKKIQAAIKAGKFTRDSYGLPIIDFKSVLEAQVEVGLGPLHTQFDQNGFAYTSLFLESAVCRWRLGGSYRTDGQKPWTVAGKVPINYNVGHVAAVGGDTVKPGGKYLVSLNKWSLDRFLGTGPHYTTNIQLIDISDPSKMQVIADTPLPDGESHYAQIVPAEVIKPRKVYPVGWNSQADAKDPKSTTAGKERVVRNGSTVEVFMTVQRSNLKPDLVEVNQGDKVIWHITNVESAENAIHGFTLPVYNCSTVLAPGQTQHVTMTADTSGTFPMYCTEFCSALHIEMFGYFLVKPA